MERIRSEVEEWSGGRVSHSFTGARGTKHLTCADLSITDALWSISTYHEACFRSLLKTSATLGPVDRAHRWRVRQYFLSLNFWCFGATVWSFLHCNTHVNILQEITKEVLPYFMSTRLDFIKWPQEAATILRHLSKTLVTDAPSQVSFISG